MTSAEGAPLGNKRAAKAPGEKRVLVSARLSPQSHEWLMRFETTKTETLDGILEILRAQSITDLYVLRTLLDVADAAKE